MTSSGHAGRRVGSFADKTDDGGVVAAIFEWLLRARRRNRR